MGMWFHIHPHFPTPDSYLARRKEQSPFPLRSGKKYCHRSSISHDEFRNFSVSTCVHFVLVLRQQCLTVDKSTLWIRFRIWPVYLTSSQCLFLYLQTGLYQSQFAQKPTLTLRLLMSYIYGAPSKARNANVYIRTYVWQRWNSLFLFAAQCFNTESMQRGFLCHICV